MKKTNLATGMIFLGIIFWGATFAFIKEAIQYVDVFSFLSVRFFIAGTLLSIIFIKRLKNLNKEIIYKGALIGFVLSLAFITQTIGLKYTTASNAGFITGLNVVIVPFIIAWLDKKWPKTNQIIAVILATIGLALLTIKSDLIINKGDIFVLVTAFVAAAHLILISRLLKNIDASLFTIVQLFTVALITGGMGVITNKGIIIPNNFIVWKAILFCAIFASAYMYSAQAYMQRYMTEIKAAIIFSFEPLFAALFAYLIISERITINIIIGGLLVFIAMIVSELKIKYKNREII